MPDPVKITLDQVKPWIIPACVSRAGEEGFVAVADLSEGSLDCMAQDFINRLYEKAGRRPPVLRRA